MEAVEGCFGHTFGRWLATAFLLHPWQIWPVCAQRLEVKFVLPASHLLTKSLTLWPVPLGFR